MTDGASGAALAPPEPVELVSAGVVDALVADVAQQIGALQREVADAEAAAAEAEARAVAEGADERSTTWTMVQLQRFLNGLRDEQVEELRALHEVTDQRVAHRLEEARAQADLLRRLGTAPAPSDQPAVDAAVDAWSSNPAVEELPPPVREPISLVPDWSAPVVPDAPLPPPVMITGAPPAPALEPAAPSESAPEPSLEAGPSSTEAAPAAQLVDESLPPVWSGADVPEPMGENFWPDQAPPQKKKGFLRRVPVMAVLQVLAVLLVLAFILLRLG
jgi:hypothetical protein